MASNRIERTLDAMVAIAGRLFGLLGNSIVTHRAEQALALLWTEGYVPVRLDEVEAWRTALRDSEDRARAIIVRGSIDNFLNEWRTFHDRQPEHTRVRAGFHRRHV